MVDILETIVAKKKLEIAKQKDDVPVSSLETTTLFKTETLSLKAFLLNPEKTGIIAEFKRASPSKGIINGQATVDEVTRAYAKHGASGISVLTDEEFFGGSLNDLVAATVNKVPLLRKDFVIDDYQIVEAKAHGASVILLIAACLSKADVKRLAAVAKSLGLEVLLEVHNEEELEHTCEDVDLVGVNNRNLKTFSVDVQTSYDLIEKIPTDKPAITESGLHDVQTILSLKRAGFKGFLIGETFMKTAAPAIAFAQFVNALKASA